MKSSKGLYIVSNVILALLLGYAYGYLCSGLMFRGHPVFAIFWYLESSQPIPIIFLCLSLYSGHVYALIKERRIPWRSIRWYEIGMWLLISAVFAGLNKFTLLTREFDLGYIEGFIWRRRVSVENLAIVGPFPNFTEFLEIITRGAFPLAIGIIIFYWLKSARREKLVSPPAVSEIDITGYIRSTLQSDVFINTLQTAVPVDEKEKEYGLHGVNWVLASILENKKQFRESAQTFLRLTIILGSIMLLILLWLGYSLVNDESTGLARRVNGLRETTQQIESATAELRRKDLQYNTQEMQNLLLTLKEEVNKEEVTPEVKAESSQAIKSIQDAALSSDLNGTVENLRKLSQMEVLKNWAGIELLSKKIDELTSMQGRLRWNIEQISNAIPNFKSQIDDLKQIMANQKVECQT